ncbi:hypothetical protein STEG23_028762, partial [Scotinomys teguina]
MFMLRRKRFPEYRYWKFSKCGRKIKSILSDKTSRNLFFFLCLNLSFAFVELLYGIWSNCLGLISDSFHMFFDSTAILAGLAASVISKWRDNDAFSYGYVRAEVLAGFVNGLFLIFTAFFIFSEGVEAMDIVIPSLMVLWITAMATKIIAIVMKPNTGLHTAMIMLTDTGTSILTMVHPSKKRQDPADRFYKPINALRHNQFSNVTWREPHTRYVPWCLDLKYHPKKGPCGAQLGDGGVFK